MTTQLHPYPSYKSSGVLWLGNVPAHWEIRCMRSVVDMRVSNVDKHIRDGEIPVRLCNYVDVYKNDYITENIPFMQATATANEIKRFQLEAGDVLITKDSEVWNDIGVPALVKHTAKDLICGYHLAILRPVKTSLNGTYLLRVLQSPTITYQFHVNSNGVTRYGLSRGAIKSVLLPIPPLPEQVAIVRYLDHVDRHICRYVNAKRKIIALLEEEKQVIINRVVTRGLEPNVRFKFSGVEWIGDVPAHWEVRRLKNWVKMNEANLPETTTPDLEFQYIDIGSVGTGHLTEEPQMMKFSTSPLRARRIVKSTDTLVSTVRTYLKAVWFAEGIKGDTVCSTGFAVLTPTKDVLPKFVSYIAQDTRFADRVMACSVGIAYPAIAETKLAGIAVAVPPLPEQDAIVEHLDKNTAPLDATIARARHQVELIQEYRTRLIADVVTGKLDTRDMAAHLPGEPNGEYPVDESGLLADEVGGSYGEAIESA